MNRVELAAALAKKTGMKKKDSEEIVETLIDIITDTLKSGEKVQLVGFGAFEVKDRAAYVGHDPRTNAAIEIPASRVPSFKAGKALKEAVSK